MSDPGEFKAEKPSQIPSWVMVGFIIGVLTMWAFQSHDPEDDDAVVETVETAPEPTAEESEVPAGGSNPMAREDQPSIELVASLFDQLREYAFWSNGRTEIGVWNGRSMAFSDRFEVVEVNGATFFRPIEIFSRLPLEGYGPDSSPILFTETAEQRAARYFKANPELAPDANSRAPVEFGDLPPPPESGGE